MFGEEGGIGQGNRERERNESTLCKEATTDVITTNAPSKATLTTGL